MNAANNRGLLNAKAVGLLILTVAYLLVLAAGAIAQDVVINWPTRTLASSPVKVYNTMVVNVRLTNANDLLYTYKIDISATPRSTQDFDKIADLILPKPAAAQPATAPPAALSSCQQALQQAKTSAESLGNLLAAKNTPVNPVQAGGKITSVEVTKTVEYWKKTIEPAAAIFDVKAKALQSALEQVPPSCQASEISQATSFFKDSYPSLRAVVESFSSNVDATHQIVVPVTLSPENDYKIVVTETYNGSATDGGSQTFTFSPESDILTLSAGTLLTEVQNRTYTSGALPNQSGNYLLVGGISPIRPILVAQLNYRIPKLSWDSFGFALSTGPALQFTGGNSGVSNVGFFGGVSVQLWHRFYVTPGVHVGEFADFPSGFTAPNQPIPTGFGQLTPTKRWTARFAIGITYKTLDFTKFTSSGSAKK